MFFFPLHPFINIRAARTQNRVALKRLEWVIINAESIPVMLASGENRQSLFIIWAVPLHWGYSQPRWKETSCGKGHWADDSWAGGQVLAGESQPCGAGAPYRDFPPLANIFIDYCFWYFPFLLVMYWLCAGAENKSNKFCTITYISSSESKSLVTQYGGVSHFLNN